MEKTEIIEVIRSDEEIAITKAELAIGTRAEIGALIEHEYITVKKGGKKVKYKYLPISYLENFLDKAFGFFGWDWVVTSEKVIVNEILVRGQLTIKLAGREKSVSGLGAKQIRITSGKEIAVENKIKTALEQDYPNAGSAAFRNACKKLGKALGRDLGREYAVEYSDLFVKGVKQGRKEIKGLPNIQALNEYKKNNTDLADKPWFISAIAKQEEAFKTLPNPGEQLKIGK